MSKPNKTLQPWELERDRVKKAAKRRRAWSYTKRGFGTVFAAFFAILFLMPIVLTITNSFMSSSEISSNYGMVFATTSSGGKVYIAEKVTLKFIPDMVSFSQYITVLLKSPEYLLKFWNSVILVGPIVVFQLTVATLASYGFARYRGRIREIIFFLYIILMLMPYQVTLVSNYIVLDHMGLLGSYAAMILPGIFSSFGVFLIKQTVDEIPTETLEAAKLDGAGVFRTLIYIVAPICRGGIVSLILLNFVDNWNMVEQPIVFLKEERMYPLSVFLARSLSDTKSAGFACGLLALAPVMLLYMNFKEELMNGIAVSSLK